MLSDNFNEYLHVIFCSVARCYLDESYKESFINNPKETLQAEFRNCTPPLPELPDSLIVQIDECSDASWRIVPLSFSPMRRAVLYIPLPPRPAEVSDQSIQDYLSTPPEVGDFASLSIRRLPWVF